MKSIDFGEWGSLFIHRGNKQLQCIRYGRLAAYTSGDAPCSMYITWRWTKWINDKSIMLTFIPSPALQDLVMQVRRHFVLPTWNLCWKWEYHSQHWLIVVSIGVLICTVRTSSIRSLIVEMTGIVVHHILTNQDTPYRIMGVYDLRWLSATPRKPRALELSPIVTMLEAFPVRR